jgi:adenine/guanine phosphoribosyltransferase-like PRPP-binding protein
LSSRAALIDDVISSGRSMVAGIELLALCGCAPVALGAAMLQGERWRSAECAALPDWQARVVGVLSTPLLRMTAGGWTA